jgi:hypothetical protein
MAKQVLTLEQHSQHRLEPLDQNIDVLFARFELNFVPRLGLFVAID